MSQFKPVILLASERSGTNLLRALLDVHPGVSSPPPAGLVNTLAAVAHRYLPLEAQPYLEELVEDVIALTQSHMNPWDIQLSVDSILCDLDDPCFWGVFRRINEIYAQHHGAACWFSKEPGLHNYAYAVHTHIPQARFLYLVRDGRDVVASRVRYGLHESHVHTAARQWASEQKQCLEFMGDPVFAGRVLKIRYEDIVNFPEQEVQRVMRFLDLDMLPEQLNFFQDSRTLQHAGQSVLWSNLAKPIDASNTGKYREYLSAGEVRIFESVARKEMRALGYGLDSAEPMNISRWMLLGFRAHEIFRKRFRKSRNSAEEVQHRRQRQLLTQRILRRFD